MAAKFATMRAAGLCEVVSDELRTPIPLERSRIRRRVRELRHLDERLSVLKAELRAGHQPRQIIHVRQTKEDV